MFGLGGKSKGWDGKSFRVVAIRRPRRRINTRASERRTRRRRTSSLFSTLFSLSSSSISLLNLLPHPLALSAVPDCLFLPLRVYVSFWIATNSKPFLTRNMRYSIIMYFKPPPHTPCTRHYFRMPTTDHHSDHSSSTNYNYCTLQHHDSFVVNCQWKP